MKSYICWGSEQKPTNIGYNSALRNAEDTGALNYKFKNYKS